MIDSQHIQPEDFALYAMRLLTLAENDVVEAHLTSCSACQLEVQAAQSDLAIVALTVDLEAPRPQARQRFLAQVAREKRVIPIDRPVRVEQPTEPLAETSD